MSSLPALVVSSDIQHCTLLANSLNTRGYQTIVCLTLEECKRVIQSREVQVVLCDRQLRDGTYQDVLRHIKVLGQDVPTIVTSRQGDWDQYFEALESGAFDLIPSPCNAEEVIRILAQLPRPEPTFAKPLCAATA
jgi:DNA-binding NtrC family response regulator